MMSTLLTTNTIAKSADWAILFSLFSFIFLIGTETFLISPLLPSIANNFDISVREAAYIVTAYVLVYALSAPWLGSISDAMGRQTFIIGGALVFFIGNLFASVASNLELLILARAITGIGAARGCPFLSLK